MLGTAEPTYADPDADLQRAADDWMAQIDPERLRQLVSSLPGPRSRISAPEAMARTDALLVDAWRASGWRVGRQRVQQRIGDGKGVEGANLVAIAEGRSDQAIV